MKPIQQRIRWKTGLQRLYRGWLRHQRLVFLLLCLLVTLIAVWKGYHDVYAFRWSDAQKKEYRDKSLKSVPFQQESFDRVIRMLQQKRADFEAQTGDERDIFGAGPTRAQE